MLAVLSFQYSFEARVFALVAATASIATGAIYLVAAIREFLSTPPDEAPLSTELAERREDRQRLVLLSALVASSTIFLYLFGVYPYSFLLSLAFLRFFAKHSWRTTLQLAVGLTIFNYLMFHLLFDLRFDAVGVLLR